MPVKKKAPGQVTGPGEQPAGSSSSTWIRSQLSRRRRA